MATPNDFGDELPPDTKAPGDTGHTEDHNRLSRELAEVQDVVTQLYQNPPRIVGYESTETALPATGSLGELYVVGPEADLYTYDPTVTPLPWLNVGSLRGEQGLPGTPGTVIGILESSTDVPPVGTAAGTLWWVPETGTSPPATTYTPSLVGDSANCGNAAALSVSMPASRQAGDIGVLCVAGNSATTLTVSQTGWTEVTGSAQQPGDTQCRMFVKELAGTESGFTVGTGTYTRVAASLMVFRNVVLSANQPHKMTFATLGTSDPASAPTVSPTVNSIVCGFWLDMKTGVSGWTITPPTQWTAGVTTGLHQTAGTTKSVSMQGAYDLDVATGAARPVTPGHQWDCSITPDARTYAYTVALAQKTA